MKLKIKLKNNKRCDECPCHYRECKGSKTLIGCTMDYYINKQRNTPIEVSFKVKRPKRCIKENGK